jgi:hypothetical protein
MLTRASDAVLTWGSRESERRLAFPCDRHLADFDGVYFRAVSVLAPVELVFRWLCQLRLAPYSYDFLDNPGFYVGRPSSTTLTPGVEALEVGQTFMTMFRLVEWEAPSHITLVSHRFHPVFGQVAVTYLVLEGRGEGGSRLVVKLLGRYPRGLPGRLTQPAMPYIDLVMMRRQLRRLKAYAERDAGVLPP